MASVTAGTSFRARLWRKVRTPVVTQVSQHCNVPVGGRWRRRRPIVARSLSIGLDNSRSLSLRAKTASSASLGDGDLDPRAGRCRSRSSTRTGGEARVQAPGPKRRHPARHYPRRIQACPLLPAAPAWPLGGTASPSSGTVPPLGPDHEGRRSDRPGACTRSGSRPRREAEVKEQGLLDRPGRRSSRGSREVLPGRVEHGRAVLELRLGHGAGLGTCSPVTSAGLICDVLALEGKA